MSDNKATPQDDASEWYSSLRDNNIRQVESSLNEIASAHGNLETQWNALDQRAEEAHDSLDTRVLIEIERDRARLLQEAQQLQNGYAALQSERQRLETHTDPAFEELVANSSPKSQLWLRTFKHKLGDAGALKQLMYADARAKAVGLKPDSPQYFSALETAVGLSAEDRSLDDFSEISESAEQRASRNATKRTQTLTPEQAGIAKDIGITVGEYAKHMKDPYSEVSKPVQVTLDDSKEAPIEVKFEQEKPARKTTDPAKHKPGAQSMTLSPAQVRFCTEAGIDPKEYVKQALDVQSGKSNHQWYEQRLRSQGLA